MTHAPRVIVLACLLTLVACGPTSSKLEYRALDSGSLDREMAYAILKPPAPVAPAAAARHVFYLLHGFNDDHRSLDRFGISDRLLDGMRNGSIPRAHVVAPNGERGFYINWYDGTNDYEDYLLEEIIPTAEQELGFDVETKHRHVIGVSMGGLGAITLGLRHPELFGTMSSLSGFFPDVHEAEELVESSPLLRRANLKRVFGDCSDKAFVDAHNPYQIVRHRESDPGQRIFLAVGDDERDEFVRTNRALHELLENEGIPHQFETYDGGHSWRDWAPVIERAMSYATQSAD